MITTQQEMGGEGGGGVETDAEAHHQMTVSVDSAEQFFSFWKLLLLLSPPAEYVDYVCVLSLCLNCLKGTPR